MAAWRRKASILFPQLQHNLNKRQYTIYQLFFDLFPILEEAHETSDEVELRKIYGFAEWCLHQRSKNLWNPAGVAFYEHLFDLPNWEDILPWLSPFVIENCSSLWEMRLQSEKFTKVEKLLHPQKTLPHKKNLFYTGELDAI